MKADSESGLLKLRSIGAHAHDHDHDHFDKAMVGTQKGSKTTYSEGYNKLQSRYEYKTIIWDGTYTNLIPAAGLGIFGLIQIRISNVVIYFTKRRSELKKKNTNWNLTITSNSYYWSRAILTPKYLHT